MKLDDAIQLIGLPSHDARAIEVLMGPLVWDPPPPDLCRDVAIAANAYVRLSDAQYLLAAKASLPLGKEMDATAAYISDLWIVRHAVCENPVVMELPLGLDWEMDEVGVKGKIGPIVRKSKPGISPPWYMVDHDGLDACIMFENRGDELVLDAVAITLRTDWIQLAGY